MNILFISNGHGEDLNGGLIVDALQHRSPEMNIFALPLVGAGKAYQNLNIPAIAPTKPLPSGGLIYTGFFTWCRDIFGGLVGLTIKQIRALVKQKKKFDLIVAIGDIVPLAFAYITGKPFVAFIVSTSAYYEGTLKLPWLTKFFLRSPRCQTIFTRDKFTERDLHARGIKKAVFCGYPIMDALQPSTDVYLTPPNPVNMGGNKVQNPPNRGHLGDDPTSYQGSLNLQQNIPQPLIALLPGSRVPEAVKNLAQLLPLCETMAQTKTMEFWAALVPSITVEHLQILAKEQGWEYEADALRRGNCTIYLSWHQFADILYQADLVLGMAGTAVEQAVGLGKPVLQIPGYGPQFTYAFAEAQMRLLGCSVSTVGKSPDEPGLITQASQKALEILADQDYRHKVFK